MNWSLKKIVSLFTFLVISAQLFAQSPKRLELLFLGHTSKHHNSDVLASLLSKQYFKKGINITSSGKRRWRTKNCKGRWAAI